jgi:hypothetical protein
MTTELLPRIDGIGAGTSSQPSARATAPDNAEFRRLLDSLERLAQDHRQAPPAETVQDADQLQEALQRADAGFTTAMDLRRQLEAAFRGRLP